MAQIFLFTGGNDYALHEEKRRWIAEFAGKHGEENLVRLEAKNLKFQAFLDEVASAPFIADNRLILLEGIPRLEKEQIQQFIEQVHPQVVVLFVDPKPDKRLSAVKELLKCAEVKTFQPLTIMQLRQWIERCTKEQKGTIEQDAVALLLDTVGSDQGLLNQELQKLLLYSNGKPIAVSHIDDLVLCAEKQVTWQLMDLLAAGNPQEAVLFAKRLIDKGESPHALWNVFLWMVSQLVLVSSAVQDGNTNAGSIVKSTGASFGSAKSLLPLARTMDQKKVANLVRLCAQSDIDLKTGAIRATNEAPQELHALLDRCLLQFAD